MKKVISLLLSIAMLLSITAGVDLSAYATSKTSSDAINWANSQIGKSLDYDGVYGAQCVDLIKYYYKYLGVTPVNGNGCDYATNALPSGWTRLKYSSGFVPKAGDIAVWTYASSSYGHVAIVASADSSGMNVVEQNGSTQVTRSHRYSYSYGTFYGVIRPNFSGSSSSGSGTSSSRQPINLGNDFYAFIIKLNSWKHLENYNGNVQIAAEGNDSNNPRQIWHFVRQSDNSYKIINAYDDTYLDADNCGYANTTNIKTYGDTGSVAQKWYIYSNGSGYNIGASYCDKVLDSLNNSDNKGNNIQLYESNNSTAQIFSIYDLRNDGVSYSKPSRPAKVSLNTAVSGKKLTVNWSKSSVNSRYDSREYDIRIYDNSGNIVFKKFGIKGTSYSVTLSSYGKYKVTVASVNNKYYNYFTMSDTVSFCLHSYSDSILEQPTCTSTGIKTYTCTICGETKTETIATIAHTYKNYITKATTSKNGSVVNKCSVCGAVKSKSTVYYPKAITLSATSYTYDGKVKKPSVKVVDSNGKTISSSNYTVTYSSGRKNVGKYNVKITFKGNYSGTITKSFTIKPKNTSISGVTAKSKGFTVKWKKYTTQTTGYQIQYSTSSKFTNAKTVTVSKNSTTSKTISKLSAKKKYYVRIRTYKTVSGTKYYSSWSKAKTVTTKK